MFASDRQADQKSQRARTKTRRLVVQSARESGYGAISQRRGPQHKQDEATAPAISTAPNDRQEAICAQRRSAVPQSPQNIGRLTYLPLDVTPHKWPTFVFANTSLARSTTFQAFKVQRISIPRYKQLPFNRPSDPD